MIQEFIEMERLVSELVDCFDTLKRKYNPEQPKQTELEFAEQPEQPQPRKRKAIVGKVCRTKRSAAENFTKYMIAVWCEYRLNGKVEKISRLQSQYRIGKTPYHLIKQYVEKEQSPSAKDIRKAAESISNYYKEKKHDGNRIWQDVRGANWLQLRLYVVPDICKVLLFKRLIN